MKIVSHGSSSCFNWGKGSLDLQCIFLGGFLKHVCRACDYLQLWAELDSVCHQSHFTWWLQRKLSKLLAPNVFLWDWFLGEALWKFYRTPSILLHLSPPQSVPPCPGLASVYIKCWWNMRQYVLYSLNMNYRHFFTNLYMSFVLSIHFWGEGRSFIVFQNIHDRGGGRVWGVITPLIWRAIFSTQIIKKPPRFGARRGNTMHKSLVWGLSHYIT